MIYNEDGITFADCMREAESLDRQAAAARADGDLRLARRLAEEARAARAFAVVMAEPRASSADDADRSDEPTAGVAPQDSEDECVWWVLVDGRVYVEEPVADGAEAMGRHAHVVEMLADRGVDRRRISLVQVGRAWGREHFTGS